MSEDNTIFFVYLDKMDSLKFNKTALFNLVNTAEKTSKDCKKLVFILSKLDNSKYIEMKKLFNVIDALRMSVSQMEAVCNQQELLNVQREFGFFELQL
jgi:hypothetical protein